MKVIVPGDEEDHSPPPLAPSFVASRSLPPARVLTAVVGNRSVMGVDLKTPRLLKGKHVGDISTSCLSGGN